MLIGEVDRYFAQQALIVGRVRDGLTEQPTLQPPTVALYYQAPAGQPLPRYPIQPRRLADGSFVLAGDPTRAFPPLTGVQTLDLRLVAEAPGYQTGSRDFSLTAVDVTPQPQPRTIAGQVVMVPLLDAPLLEHDFDLLPLPMSLSGRVVNADDPSQAVDGAEVRITAPAPRGPVFSSTNGFFNLTDLPVARQVTLRIAKAGFVVLETPVMLDYRQPVYQQTFALST